MIWFLRIILLVCILYRISERSCCLHFRFSHREFSHNLPFAIPYSFSPALRGTEQQGYGNFCKRKPATKPGGLGVNSGQVVGGGVS